MVANQIDRLRKSQDLKDKLSRLVAEINQLKQEINAKTRELAVLKSEEEVSAVSKARQYDLVRGEVLYLLWRARTRGAASDANKRSEAVTLVAQALALDPSYPDSHDLMGDLFVWDKNYNAAIREYRTAVSLAPDSGEYRRSLGFALKLAGHGKEALEETRIAVKLSPNSFFARWSLGDRLAEMENWSGAVEAYRAAIRLLPADESWESTRHHLHTELAFALRKSGDIPGAVAEYLSAIRYGRDWMHRDCSTPHWSLSLIVDNSSDIDSIISGLRNLASQQPDDPSTQFYLGRALWKEGRREEAAKVFSQFLRRAEDNPCSRSRIKEAEERLRMFEK